MNITGNTILITGGASGIGRALAEAFHKLGNQVIICGRRQAALDEVTAANPGMVSLQLDITDKASIAALAEQAIARFPALNVLINNAGIMREEDIKQSPAELHDAEQTIATNLSGTLRMSAALLPHLLEQPRSTLVTVSSGLAFVPMFSSPTYSATKAAIHSYSMSLRHQLQGTSVEVVEIAPPYVQTELLGEFQATDPNAMPLAEFIDEVMELLERGESEVIVERCKPLRFAAESGRMAEMIRTVNRL
ncbi:oxidoreductase [Pandoraea thiooxydans]|uniref:Oxidoreductase n=1 Tax=Pandoraea thiooxydans TaxID=445709 RepID=A0A0G3EQR8_9BURK|nr:SDR family oxidoreductase [Pandoraea thiooxydans]AKJ69335.1 oxidoreductase [Pandoraea thiooxydans]APR96954.1 oxidoreductase [Pandoraea thiooxydans]